MSIISDTLDSIIFLLEIFKARNIGLTPLYVDLLNALLKDTATATDDDSAHIKESTLNGNDFDTVRSSFQSFLKCFLFELGVSQNAWCVLHPVPS